MARHPIGNRTKVRVDQGTKIAPPRSEFDLIYGKGISKYGDILDLAVTQKGHNSKGGMVHLVKSASRAVTTCALIWKKNPDVAGWNSRSAAIQQKSSNVDGELQLDVAPIRAGACSARSSRPSPQQSKPV